MIGVVLIIRPGAYEGKERVTYIAYSGNIENKVVLLIYANK